MDIAIYNNFRQILIWDKSSEAEMLWKQEAPCQK